MVLPLRPAKFYGSSLPRPRIYTDVKLNDSRVDPPTPVMDPFISWAQEAHWSMGGLSFKRLHLQGRIEGSADKIRKMREKVVVERDAKSRDLCLQSLKQERDLNKRSGSVSPPGAPRADKRKRKYVQMIEEEEVEDETGEEEEEEEVVEVKRKTLARKLVGEFDKVVKESEVRMRTRSKGVEDSVMKAVAEVNREEGSVDEKTVEKKGKKSGLGKRKQTSLQELDLDLQLVGNCSQFHQKPYFSEGSNMKGMLLVNSHALTSLFLLLSGNANRTRT